MSDSQTMMRMLIAVGLLMLLVSALYPGQNPAWATLQNDLSHGPSFPTWGQPFTLQARGVDINVVANGSWGLSSQTNTFGNKAISPVNVFNDSVTPCHEGAHVTGGAAYPGQYWDCLNSKDGEKSGVGLSGLAFVDVNGIEHNGYQMVVQLANITGIDPQNQILNVTVVAQCNSNSQPISFNADILQTKRNLGGWPTPIIYPQALSIAHATMLGNKTCNYGGLPAPWGSRWDNVTLVANFQNGIYVSTQRIGNFSGAQLLINTETWAMGLQISYLHVIVYYLNENSSSLNASCGSFDIGCVVAKIWNALVGTFLLVGGAFLFAFQWLAALLTFGVSIIVNFFIGFITVMVWFMAMPGVPGVVQAFIDVPFVAMLGFLFYSIIKLIRGGGGT